MIQSNIQSAGNTRRQSFGTGKSRDMENSETTAEILNSLAQFLKRAGYAPVKIS